MRNVFITTNNVNRCTELCAELEDPASLIGPSLAMINGPAGRGKTEFAKHFATNSRAEYIRPMNIRTPAMLLREIVFELCEVRPRYIEACLKHIEDEMDRERRLILVDEADLMPISMLEMLRNLNECYSVPIVLIGEESLKTKIASRRRLNSRIRGAVEFGSVVTADLVLFYQKALGVEISPNVAGILLRACGGDWRPVLKAAIGIERALETSGLTEISEDLARAVTNGAGR